MQKNRIIPFSLFVVIFVFVALLLYSKNRLRIKDNSEKQGTDVIVDNTFDISSDEFTYGPRTEKINHFMENIHYTDTTEDK